jgi:Flp pilus assembly protein CpaB
MSRSGQSTRHNREIAQHLENPAMKKNLVSLLVIAFVVATIATGLFYGLFVANGSHTAAQQAAATLVVAKHNLSRGTVLQAEDLKTVEWPANKPMAGGFVDAADPAGLTVLEPIQENEPIVQARLTPKTSAAAGLGVPKGMRAVTVHVSESGGIVTMLRSGHKVDVQVVGEGKEAQLRTVLQNIEVLNVPGQENGRPIVNLLVKPDEADMVGLADAVARIRLILRNPQDGSTTARNSVLASSFFRVEAPKATAANIGNAPASKPAAPIPTAALRPSAQQ